MQIEFKKIRIRCINPAQLEKALHITVFAFDLVVANLAGPGLCAGIIAPGRMSS